MRRNGEWRDCGHAGHGRGIYEKTEFRFVAGGLIKGKKLEKKGRIGLGADVRDWIEAFKKGKRSRLQRFLIGQIL